MNKSILVSLTILALSTSAALAAHRTHHGRPMNANAFAGPGASPVGGWGGVSSNDRALYIKNLHDAGYDPKNNFNANGTIKTQ
jgi:hypothetical protein